jgi:hypothetical protein
MNDGQELYCRVLQTELTRLARARTCADLVRWRDQLVTELFDPTSEHAQALEQALNKHAQPGHTPEDSARAAAFLGEWSDLLVATLRRLKCDKIIPSDKDPDKLATVTLAAICGGALIAATANDRSELIKALDMALHLISGPASSRDRGDR